jgi:hypothetical protein
VSPKRRKIDAQKFAGGEKEDGRREHGSEKLTKSEKGSKVEAKSLKGLPAKDRAEPSGKPDTVRPKKRREDGVSPPDERGAAADKKDDGDKESKDKDLGFEKRLKAKGKSGRDLGTKTLSSPSAHSSHSSSLPVYQSGGDYVDEESSNSLPAVHPLSKLRCVVLLVTASARWCFGCCRTR